MTSSKKAWHRRRVWMGCSLGVALAFLSSAAVAAPYQAQVLYGSFACNAGWCKAPFPVVPAGKQLTVTSASCVFTVSGAFIDAQLEWQIANGSTMYLGLASEWLRQNGSNLNGTFGKQTSLLVPAGKRALAVVHISGNLIGAHCQLFGALN